MATINEILANLQNAGINVSTNTRREIFKKEIISQLTDKDAKTYRRKIRKLIIAYAETICAENGKNVKTINAFNEIYKQSYAVNDYTLASICSDNMRDINKQILTKALNFCKPKSK